jgi:hypothetical protein
MLDFNYPKLEPLGRNHYVSEIAMTTTTTVLQLVEDVLLVARQTVWFVYDGILAYFSLHVKLFLDSILKLMDTGKETSYVASPIADLTLAEFHQQGHLKVVCSNRVNKRNDHYL